MWRACRIVLTLSVVVLLASPALGQQRQRGQRQGQRGQFGGFGQGGLAGLLQNEGVQKELKLDQDQLGKVKEAVQKVQEKNRDAFAKLRDLGQEERFEKTRELTRTISDQTLAALSSILKPEQTKRLKQIELQQGGTQAFNRPDVQTALNLTNEQKEKIKTINDDVAREMRGLFQGGDFQQAREKMTSLRKESMERIQSVLSAEQKKTWKDMTGDPFEVTFQRRRGGQ